MAKKVLSKLKLTLALLLIVVMATPSIAQAANPYDEKLAMWSDLPVIEPPEIDLSRFPELAALEARHNPLLLENMGFDIFNERNASPDGMDALSALAMIEALTAFTAEEQLITMEMADRHVPRNELSEPAPEQLEEILRTQMEIVEMANQQAQDFSLREMDEHSLTEAANIEETARPGDRRPGLDTQDPEERLPEPDAQDPEGRLPEPDTQYPEDRLPELDVQDPEEEHLSDIETQSFAPLSGLPPLVVNPFGVSLGASDTVSLNTGAVTYRTHILSLPGRGGFGFNLDLVYSSTRADFRRLDPSFSTSQPRNNIHGLGVGWIFDLPYLYHNELYVPGRGSFAVNGNTIVDYTLQDMRLFNDTSFVSGSLRSTRRLTFLNGTSYFFHNELVIGMRDRYNNTILFEYANIASFGNARLLTRITDSSGQQVNFNYFAADASTRVASIVVGGVTRFTIYLSAANGDFVVSRISNQVTETTFVYDIMTVQYCFTTKTPRNNTSVALLRTVNYQSGARLEFSYARATINMGVPGSRHIFRAVSRALIGNNNRQYNLTTFTYTGDHTAFGAGRDRPGPGFEFSVVVLQNNGLRTRYTFNYRHLNVQQSTYNASNTNLSRKWITYNNDRLPTNITSEERRGSFTRTNTQLFTYNRYGQVTVSVSPLARGSTAAQYRTEFTYDNRFGLMVSMVYRTNANTVVQQINTLSADGRRIIATYMYQAGTRLSRTTFNHDAFGNITDIREFPDSRGSASIHTQFAHNNGFTLPSHVRTLNVRNVDNQLVSGGTGIVERRFTYDVMGRVLTQTDPSGYVTSFQYDAIGRVTRITHPTGGFETFTYNDTNNTLQHRTVLAAICTHQYDRLGNLLTTSVGGNIIRTNIYDNRMRLVETRNFQGIASSQRTAFAYDIYDRVVDTRALSSAGIIMKQVITEYHDVFNSAGDSRIASIQHGTVAAGAAPAIRTFSHFDRFGRLTQEGTEGGRIMNYSHDLIGRVTREWSLGIDNTFTYNIHGVISVRNIGGFTASNVYDHVGRLTRSYDFRGSDQRFTYDDLSRVTRHYKPVQTNANGTRYHTVTTFLYDNNSNIIRTQTWDSLPNQTRNWATTTNSFSHNRLITTQTGDATVTGGMRTDFTYNLAGNILTKRVGNPIAGQPLTTYAYDNRGRLTSVTDALGRAETFTYDQNSMLLTHTDRNGTQFRYTYDNMGRVTRVGAYRGGVVQATRGYSFHQNGMLRWISNGPHTIHFEYDAQGRVRRRTEQCLQVTAEHTYVYNAANNITQFATSVRGTPQILQTIEYDIFQRVSRVSDWSGWVNGVMVTYTYDANGNRTSATHNNGTRTDYTFNLANQVTSVITRRGTVVLSRFDYTYRLNGNVHQVAEQYQNTALNRTITYTYDAVGRLIREQVTGNGALTRTFTYDRRGNRTRMDVTGTVGRNYAVTYAYDLNNRLLTETRTGSDPRTTHFTYDNNGNQLTSSTGVVTETRTYDAFNQLTRVARPGITILYSYRADGLRDTRTINNNRNFHIWNNGQIVLELDMRRDVINRFYIALVVNHRLRSHHHGWYIYNARGDVVQRTSDQGNVLETYRYDAFGNTIWPSDINAPPEGPGANNNPFRFGGMYWDWERGEYMTPNRSLNPRTGRWTSPDPFWNVGNMQSGNAAILQSANLYAYVMNNPMRWVDPWGLFAEMPLAIGDHDGGGGSPIRPTPSINLGRVTLPNNPVNRVVQGAMTGATNRIEHYAAGIDYVIANPVQALVNMYIDMVIGNLTNPIGVATPQLQMQQWAIQSTISNIDTMVTYGICYGYGMIVGSTAVDAAIIGAAAAVSYGAGKVVKYVSSKVTAYQNTPPTTTNPFNRAGAQVQNNVDPNTLTPMRDLSRLDPADVRSAGNAAINNPDLRITVNRSGQVIDGHHRLRFAMERGLGVNIEIQAPSFIPRR